MDPEQPWPRGRHGSWSSDGRESGSHSPRRTHHSGSPSHKYRPSKPLWDDTVQDLASMRLTPAELARKLASRQSTNMMLARAQLLERSRRSGSQSLSLPPSLAARLQAARQQSVESILAQSSSTLLASQKVRQTEAAAVQGQEEGEHHIQPENVKELVAEEKREEVQSSPHHHRAGYVTTSNDTPASTVKSTDGASKGKTPDQQAAKEISEHEGRTANQTESPRMAVERRQPEGKATVDVSRQLDVSQIAATRTSLDHTINMVVNTCRELWLQLEEERLTREHLQRQLQQQGNVITTLTAELLQIQDQQEAILQEVSDARASGLWGAGEVDLGDEGGGGEYVLSGHITPGRAHGGRSSHYQTSGRHPQRSILRATRTIHPPHQRQAPQSLGRSHQTNHAALSQRPPHSPRPHQPSSRSHTHNLQMHRPSPPPEPPLSPRPESASHANYKSSVSRQIRDALGNEQPVPGTRERNSGPVSLAYSNMSQETLQKDMREQEESQVAVGPGNKENHVIGGDLAMDEAVG